MINLEEIKREIEVKTTSQYNINTMETKHTKEERFLSDDAIALMSMLPQGLTDEWQEKSFSVFGKTKVELAAPELLKALSDIISSIDNGFGEFKSASKDSLYYKYAKEAIKKATT